MSEVIQKVKEESLKKLKKLEEERTNHDENIIELEKKLKKAKESREKVETHINNEKKNLEEIESFLMWKEEENKNDNQGLFIKLKTRFLCTDDTSPHYEKEGTFLGYMANGLRVLFDDGKEGLFLASSLKYVDKSI